MYKKATFVAFLFLSVAIVSQILIYSKNKNVTISTKSIATKEKVC